MSDITDQDILFVNELVNLTATGKLQWKMATDGKFVSSRQGVVATLQTAAALLPDLPRTSLIMSRVGDRAAGRVLEQRLGQAELSQRELALNGALAFLRQLVADSQSPSGSIYTDFLGGLDDA